MNPIILNPGNPGQLTPGTIKFVRLSYGWRQSDLAERAGITRALITLIEKGERRLTTATEEKIRKAFQFTPDGITLLIREIDKTRRELQQIKELISS